ncbi:hypothetical protein EVG20_g7431 [Dentipellis fragilis]|uniref:Restriction endonuclease domain-containing protein n=1 Tax=Dentipellis fragilis TaxID=205917 RepID=A0A4Y9YCX8_9AGAM|nr:hypothetical protein EVG20_g7431 [Dentipellis fragilis]
MFLHWHSHKSATQFRQYGALDKYLNLKFPLDLVKPQNELRIAVDEVDAFFDAKDYDEVQAIANELELGDVSVSSYGGVVHVDREGRKYPDFVVASYFGVNEDDVLIAEAPRLVIEVGSLGPPLKSPSRYQKKEIMDQLLGYLEQLAIESKDWEIAPHGIALIGTEAAFLYLSSKANVSGLCTWKHKGGRSGGAGTWYSIFDEDSQPSPWRDVIDKISESSTKSAEEFGRHGKVPVVPAN